LFSLRAVAKKLFIYFLPQNFNTKHCRPLSDNDGKKIKAVVCWIVRGEIAFNFYVSGVRWVVRKPVLIFDFNF